MSADGNDDRPTDELRLRLDRIQTRALVAGLRRARWSRLAAWLLWPAHFFPAYLVGYVFWVGIALGCLGLTMLHHLVGGSWGLVIRRPLEAGAMTLLPLALLVPADRPWSVASLYPWARPDAVGHERGLHTSPYLKSRFS